jgi:hypothetical protein
MTRACEASWDQRAGVLQKLGPTSAVDFKASEVVENVKTKQDDFLPVALTRFFHLQLHHTSFSLEPSPPAVALRTDPGLQCLLDLQT